ncbi:ABC transporter substrate-binding protein [Amycolatopsis sp. GM8]|uniref:ABC transporter substrate-binding protein n=1 Tax=Amycolatopsis sp. GM8 TaxID=2896530 RepID=UPI001F160DC0|nr:ABC transporter substrate-binding protein [Amycolatopsis sp. GM8]
MRTSKAAGLMTAGLLVLAAAAACGNGTSSGSSGTAEPPQAPLKPASATASPVLVGFHNLEGGSISLPDYRQGFQAGIDYVNSDLGGINSHPMQMVDCKTDGTPESSVNCANQFVQKNVVMAVQGADFGADAMLPVLKSAGIVEFGGFPLTPGMNSAVGDAYFMNYSAQEGYAADVVQQKALGAKTLAVVMVDAAASHQSYDTIIAPAAQKIGVQTKVFYYPKQVEWTTEAATVMAAKPDAVTLWSDGTAALAAVSALRSGGFSGQIDAGANTEIIGKLSTSVLKNVNFNAPVYQTDFASFPPAVQQDMDIFNRYMKKDASNVVSQAQAQQGFYAAVLAADSLRQIPGDQLTAKTVRDGMGKVKGEREIFRTAGYDCSTPTWPGTTACATGGIYATPNSDKKLVPLPNQPVDISSVRPAG